MLEDTKQILHDNIPGIGTHLAVDTENRTVYWVLFTAETTYKIYKTTYTGETTQIGQDQTGSISRVDIAVGNGYFYILDSDASEVRKYNQTTGTLDTRISISPGAERIIAVTGR